MTKKQIKALRLCWHKPRSMRYLNKKLKLGLTFKKFDYTEFFDGEFYEHVTFDQKKDYPETTLKANKNGIEFLEQYTKERASDFRWWITTAIAIAALVLTIIFELRA
ncbi:MAG: hypothetical protein FWC13_05210 [Oscillospiraceae bacterium]|nr:hypothetical protein [Oscillospiraceae bacterium]